MRLVNSIEMRRLLFLIGLALSLAFAPGPALASFSSDCPMGHSALSIAGHQHKGCCTPVCLLDCAAACPGAVMPAIAAAVQITAIVQPFATWSPTALASASYRAEDPPPRTTIS